MPLLLLFTNFVGDKMIFYFAFVPFDTLKHLKGKHFHASSKKKRNVQCCLILLAIGRVETKSQASALV